MAGDWIKMRMDLPEDPAVFKIATMTHLDRHSVVGRLYAFWSWADKHAVDGRVDGATPQVVDAVVQFDGFSSALEAVKWIQIGPDHIAIPRYERHNGESAKERSLKNQRQSRWREKSKRVDDLASTKASTREEKRRSKPPVVPIGFARFWAAYPRKTAKAGASRAFAKANPDEVLLASILIAVDRQAKSEQWTRDGGQFIPHAATWLNGRRWEDEAPLGEARRVAI